MNFPDTFSLLFGIVTIGVVLFLALYEWRRYRLHQTDTEDGITYPLPRFLRREAVLFLILAIVLGFGLRPEGLPPTTELLWLGACLVGAILVCWLAIRDLRYTSVSMAEAHQRFQQNSAEELKALYDEAASQSKSSETGE